jgi:Raf kinase inhibitor-like YbhB/YbcL family protein
MSFKLVSAAFSDGETIPVRYTCDAEDVSPPLAWEDAPDGTKSLALICDDPDAPMGTWVHWVLYDLSAKFSQLSEAIPPAQVTPDGAKQGKNDFGRFGYGGPCPPPGPAHRYFFKLYALDIEPGLPAGATKADLLQAIEGHVLEEAQIMGKYQRGEWG